MTTPAGPDTGAGDAPDTGSSAPENADPTTDAPQDAPGTDATDWQAEAEKHKALARKHEARAKANKKALDEALAQAKPKDGEPTFEQLQQQLAERDERIGEYENERAETAYEKAIHRAAREAGADGDALYDSSSFRAAVLEELGDDFDDDELVAAVAKVTKEYATKPRFAAGQRPPGRSGADITGGPGAPRQITEAELNRMTPEQIVAAQEKGQLNSLLGIT